MRGGQKIILSTFASTGTRKLCFKSFIEKRQTALRSPLQWLTENACSIAICRRPRDVPSDLRRPPSAAQRHRVQAPVHPLARRRQGDELRGSQAPVWGNPCDTSRETFATLSASRDAISTTPPEIPDTSAEIVASAATCLVSKTTEVGTEPDSRAARVLAVPPHGFRSSNAAVYRTILRAYATVAPGIWILGRKPLGLRGPTGIRLPSVRGYERAVCGPEGPGARPQK